MRSDKQNYMEQQEDDFNDIAYQHKNHMKLSNYIEKPKFKISTEYKATFQKKKLPKSKRKKYEDHLNKPQTVGMKTQYGHSFLGQKQPKAMKKKPEDQLISNISPFEYLTSYQTQFVGHKGMNQYVKMKNQKLKNFTKTDFRTTYSTSFKHQKSPHEQRGALSAQKSNSFMKKTNFDRKIVTETSKSSYSLQFSSQEKEKDKKDQNSTKNSKSLMNPEIEIKIPSKSQSFLDEKPHDYSTKFIFCTPANKDKRVKTVYQVDFSDTPIKNTAGRNMLKFRKYQQKQINELRNRMKTCYC